MSSPQLDRPERDAYDTAVEVMAAASQIPGAREGMASFLEKRPAAFPMKVSSELPEWFPWWEERPFA